MRTIEARPGGARNHARWLGAALAALVLAGGCEETPPQEPGVLPPGFLLGASVAGFQVDMGCPTLSATECEDPRSDWYVWVTDASLIAERQLYLSGDPPSSGPGHWELYDEDFRLAQEEVGLNAFRTSIEWSRVFPTSTVGLEAAEELRAVASPAALAHYRAMLEALRDRGLAPLVTLNHYTLPTWMHDAAGCHWDLESCSPRGWLDREVIVHEIAKYAGFVAAEYGDLVDRWATLNEPFAVVLSGYGQPGADRSNPPGVTFAYTELKAVAAAMIEGHARMVDAVRAADVVDADGDGRATDVGLVFALVPVHPGNASVPLDQEAAVNVEYLYNWSFLDAVTLGDVDEDLDGVAEHRAELAGRLDWLGINYYSSMWVEGTESPAAPELSPLSTFDLFTMDIRWDHPAGIRDAIRLAGDRYPGVPLYITENGTAEVDDPDVPSRYLVEHLTWVSQAIAEGYDVRGYFYWSFMDNYEWNHGMDMRFGLYAVDPADPQKRRQARPLVQTYARITAAGRIPSDLLEQYPID